MCTGRCFQCCLPNVSIGGWNIPSLFFPAWLELLSKASQVITYFKKTKRKGRKICGSLGKDSETHKGETEPCSSLMCPCTDCRSALSPVMAETPMLPSSLMLLNTAHEYLGRRSWCCNSDGALLRFYVSAAGTCLAFPRSGACCAALPYCIDVTAQSCQSQSLNLVPCALEAQGALDLALNCRWF